MMNKAPVLQDGEATMYDRIFHLFNFWEPPQQWQTGAKHRSWAFVDFR